MVSLALEIVNAGATIATVNVNVCVADPEALVAVIVYAVAPATVFGVPVSAPVEVLKLIPGGVALIAKLAISPPVEETVKPVAAVLTVLVSEDDERVKAGAASGAVVEVGVGSWVGFGFPQSAGRLDNKSIKLLKGEYCTGPELIIFPLFVLTETEKL